MQLEVGGIKLETLKVTARYLSGLDDWMHMMLLAEVKK